MVRAYDDLVGRHRHSCLAMVALWAICCRSVWTEACRIRPPKSISNFIYMEEGGENGKSFFNG